MAQERSVLNLPLSKKLAVDALLHPPLCVLLKIANDYSRQETGGIVSTGFAVELNFMILLYHLEEDTVRKLKG